mgnify:CR=1 FL=1
MIMVISEQCCEFLSVQLLLSYSGDSLAPVRFALTKVAIIEL